MAGDRVDAGASKHIFEPFAVLKGNIGKVRIGYLEQTADQFDGVMREFFVGLGGVPRQLEKRRTMIVTFLYRVGNELIFRVLCSLASYLGILAIYINDAKIRNKGQSTK